MQKQITIFDVFEEMDREEEERKVKPPEDFSLRPLSLPDIDNDIPNVDLDEIINMSSTHIRNLKNLDFLDRAYLTSNPLSYDEGAYNTSDIYDELYYLRQRVAAFPNFESSKDFFFSYQFITGYEDEVLDDYGIEGKYRKYYKPTYLVENFETLPVINFVNTKAKIEYYFTRVIDYIFSDFPRKNELGEYKIHIWIDEDFERRAVETYGHFNSENRYKDILDLEDYPLYFLIQPFIDLIGYQNNTFSSMLSSLFDYLVYDFKDHILTIDFKDITLPVNYNGELGLPNLLNRFYFFFGFLRLLNDVHDYFEERIEAFLENKINSKIHLLNSVKGKFTEALNGRLVPLEDVNHKAAVKEAKRRGLTHLFIPFDNKVKAFPEEVPVALYVENDDHAEIYPPGESIINNVLNVENLYVEDYVFYYDDCPTLATRKEPHIIGKNKLIKASLNEEAFHAALLEDYQDWEHYEVMKETFQLIDKYKSLKKRLLDLKATEETEEVKVEDVFQRLLPVFDVDIEKFSSLDKAKESLNIEGSDVKINVKEYIQIDDEDRVYQVVNIELVYEEEPYYLVSLVSVDDDRVHKNISSLDSKFLSLPNDKIESLREMLMKDVFMGKLRQRTENSSIQSAMIYDDEDNILTVFERNEIIYRKKMNESNDFINTKSEEEKNFFINLFDELKAEGHLSSLANPFLFPLFTLSERSLLFYNSQSLRNTSYFVRYILSPGGR